MVPYSGCAKSVKKGVSGCESSSLFSSSHVINSPLILRSAAEFGLLTDELVSIKVLLSFASTTLCYWPFSVIRLIAPFLNKGALYKWLSSAVSLRAAK